MEDACAISAPELFGPGDKRAVAGDFVMFDRLRRGDQGRVQDLFVIHIHFAGDSITFFKDAIDGGQLAV